jgi:pheromone a factor receptor
MWVPQFSDSAGLTQISASRFSLAFVIAIPAAILCTNRRVYLMTTENMPSTIVEVIFIPDSLPLDTSCFFTQKRRAIMFDLALGLGIPIINLILSTFHTNMCSQTLLKKGHT